MSEKSIKVGFGISIVVVAIIAIAGLIVATQNDASGSLQNKRIFPESIETNDLKVDTLSSNSTSLKVDADLSVSGNLKAKSIETDELKVDEITGSVDISGNVKTTGYLKSGNVQFPVNLGNVGQVLSVGKNNILEFSTEMTNLSNTSTAQTVILESSSGTSTTLTAATKLKAGVMSAQQVIDLDGQVKSIAIDTVAPFIVTFDPFTTSGRSIQKNSDLVVTNDSVLSRNTPGLELKIEPMSSEIDVGSSGALSLNGGNNIGEGTGGPVEIGGGSAGDFGAGGDVAVVGGRSEFGRSGRVVLGESLPAFSDRNQASLKQSCINMESVVTTTVQVMSSSGCVAGDLLVFLNTSGQSFYDINSGQMKVVVRSNLDETDIVGVAFETITSSGTCLMVQSGVFPVRVVSGIEVINSGDKLYASKVSDQLNKVDLEYSPDMLIGTCLSDIQNNPSTNNVDTILCRKSFSTVDSDGSELRYSSQNLVNSEISGTIASRKPLLKTVVSAKVKESGGSDIDLSTGFTDDGVTYINTSGTFENSVAIKTVVAIGYNTEYIFTFEANAINRSIIKIVRRDLKILAETIASFSAPGQVDKNFGILTEYVGSANVLCFVTGEDSSMTRNVHVISNENSFLSVTNNTDVTVRVSNTSDLKCVRMTKFTESCVLVLLIEGNSASLHFVSRNGDSNTTVVPIGPTTTNYRPFGDVTVDQQGNIYVALLNLGGSVLNLFTSTDGGTTFTVRKISLTGFTLGNYKVCLTNFKGILNIVAQWDERTDFTTVLKNGVAQITIDANGKGIAKGQDNNTYRTMTGSVFYDTIATSEVLLSPWLEVENFIMRYYLPWGKTYYGDAYETIKLASSSDTKSTKMIWFDKNRGAAIFPLANDDFPNGFMTLFDAFGKFSISTASRLDVTMTGVI